MGDLEEFNGVYDWDEAFRQNHDQPVYEVTDEMRYQAHGAEPVKAATPS